MTLPVPPSVWDALQQFLQEGKSGQVTLEVREGEVVACRITSSIRVQRGGPTDGLEYKAPALVR